MQYLHWIRSILGIFLAIIALFFVPHSARASTELKIGVFVCLTGPCASWGSNSVKGIQLAVDEINAAGGVLGRKLSIQVEDSEDGISGAKAVAAFEKLVRNPDIKYFIGPTWSTGGIPVIPNILRHPEVLVTSPSLGVPDFDRAADNIFNVWPHDQFSSEALARYAISQGWRKVGILSTQDPWCSVQGNTFAAEFERLGGKVLTKIEPPPSLNDPRGEITKIRYTNPDVVFFSSYLVLGIGARELRSLGYTGPIMTVLMDFDQLKAASGALENAIFAKYPDPVTDFSNRFEKRFGTKPGTSADTAYDTVKLYAAAIEKSKSIDPVIVKSALQNIKFPGASGPIEFDEFGGVRKAPVLHKVVGEGSLALP